MLNRCRRVLLDIVNPVLGEASNYRGFREYPDYQKYRNFRIVDC
jgi:hypothetical protein